MEVAFCCILVNYTLDGHHDPVVVLDLLDRVKAGVCQVVFIVPFGLDKVKCSPALQCRAAMPQDPIPTFGNHRSQS